LRTAAASAGGGEGRRIVVVTGANRGIGYELARQLALAGDIVVLTARSDQAAAEAAERIGTGEIHARQLDVTDPASVGRLAEWAEGRLGRVDALVNNAAIHYDTWQRASDADLTVVREAFDTNLFGAWQTILALLPLLRRSEHGRIVNVSSEGGSLAAMGGGIPAYRTSKAALNALTRTLAAELDAERILVNAVCPGWVATDMGGPGGRPVADGAASVRWAIDLPDDGPTGGFFRDGHPSPGELASTRRPGGPGR
jgi:NAD(P)-dependent dehydrogenase (short-subunit alcohol dehydrogenase family)